MTDSPSEEVSEDAEDTSAVEAAGAEAAESDDAEASAADVEPNALAEFAAAMATVVGADEWSADFGTIKLFVSREQWVAAIAAAKDEGFDFFSWLSAVDWAKDAAVGEDVADVDALDERYEVMCRLSNLRDASGIILSTNVQKDDATMPSIVTVYGGAGWHERECAEMFGIDFTGNPNLAKLYLPDAFEGFPLRKSYPLLSREVKPWPGKVDVEPMPSTENKEAEALAADSPAGANADGGGDAS